MGYAFISYRRENRAPVEVLAKQLTDAGVEIWFDQNLAHGVAYPQELAKRIESAAVVIPVMSSAPNESDWMTNEIAWAQKYRVRILPVSLDGSMLIQIAALNYEKADTHGRVGAAFIDAVRALTGSSLPRRLTLDHTKSGFNDKVGGVAFHPNSDVLAGGDDRYLWVWRVSNPDTVFQITSGIRPCWPVEFMPNGEYLASGARAQTGVHLWNWSTGGLHRILGGDQVSSLSFSADGKLLAVGANETGPSVWDVISMQRKWRYTNHPAKPRWPARISPDGRWLLVDNARGNGAGIWKVKSGEFHRALLDHKGDVTSLAFVGDGSRAITGSVDKTARIWNVATGTVTHVLIGHTGAVRATAASADGRLVVTASDDRTIRLWNSTTGELQCIGTLDTPGVVESLAYAPNGVLLATGLSDRTVQVWRLGP
jgi:WD40 repeat protein